MQYLRAKFRYCVFSRFLYYRDTHELSSSSSLNCHTNKVEIIFTATNDECADDRIFAQKPRFYIRIRRSRMIRNENANDIEECFFYTENDTYNIKLTKWLLVNVQPNEMNFLLYCFWLFGVKILCVFVCTCDKLMKCTKNK